MDEPLNNRPERKIQGNTRAVSRSTVMIESSLRTSVNSVLEIRMLHPQAVSDLQQIPVERARSIPRAICWAEIEANTTVFLQIRAKIWDRLRRILKREGTVVVKHVFRTDRVVADPVRKWSAEEIRGRRAS